MAAPPVLEVQFLQVAACSGAPNGPGRLHEIKQYGILNPGWCVCVFR
jgi:hypothetical protein